MTRTATAIYLTPFVMPVYVFLEGFSKPSPENYTDWNILKLRIFENTDAIAFVGWGIFEEFFFERLSREYQDGEFDHSYDDPIMLNEIIGGEMLYVNWKKLGFKEEDLEF